jgi:hypothetical protein
MNQFIYINIWSLILFSLVAGATYLIAKSPNIQIPLLAGLFTGLSNSAWNYIIEVTGITTTLNYDHPIFRISWADGLNGFITYFFVNVSLSYFALNRQITPNQLLRISLVAAIIVTACDTYFF